MGGGLGSSGIAGHVEGQGNTLNPREPPWHLGEVWGVQVGRSLHEQDEALRQGLALGGLYAVPL